jgi:hypothetical protein
MALDANELFSSVTVSDNAHGVEAHVVHPKTFAVFTGGDELPVLTPVAYNTSLNQWVPWTNGGANGAGTICGFVFPNIVSLLNASEVLGNVIMAGKIRYADIAAAVAERGVESEANLKTALRSGPRALGLYVQGLDMVR